jgi:hypothetical protein
VDEEPLIGVIICEDGHAVARYFTEDSAAHEALAPKHYPS